MVHVEPIVWLVRMIDTSYGKPFQAICTITKSGHDSIFISGLKGNISKKALLELHSLFYDMGYRHATFIHKQKSKTITIREGKDNG